AALPEQDQDAVRGMRGVVLGQALPQPAGFHAHDRVGPGIEGCVLVEDVQADGVFLDVLPLAFEGAVDDELKKAAQALGALEARMREDAAELLPDERVLEAELRAHPRRPAAGGEGGLTHDATGAAPARK